MGTSRGGRVHQQTPRVSEWLRETLTLEDMLKKEEKLVVEEVNAVVEEAKKG